MNKELLHVSLTNNALSAVMPGFNVVSERLNINIDIPLLQQRLAYQRGHIDTLAHHNSLRINPSLRFTQKFGKDRRNEICANASFTAHDLDLLQTIAYRDDSQPQLVLLGNANLKARQTSTVGLNFMYYINPQRPTGIGFNTRLDYSHRDIAQSVQYDTRTGIYTYQPVNLGGSNTWSNTLVFGTAFDEQRHWTMESSVAANLHHSIDQTMLAEETCSRLNAVNTLTLHDNAYIQYSKGALNVKATSDIRWRHSEGKMRDFSTLNATDFQYGLNARYTLPVLKTTILADANMYSRRGYGSANLNTDDFVVNASISQPFFKGKLIARIEAFDLLHNLSSTQYEVNAQGRIETWYRSLPHYVMAHLVYHWNKNPKKK